MPLTVHVHGDLPPPSRASTAEPLAPSLTFDSPRITLGRGEGCDVRLPDPSVSHRHVSIRQRGSEHVLVDEGSTNGTRLVRVVDGRRAVTLLTAQAPQALQSGDMVRIGTLWVELEIGSDPPTRKAPERAKEIALDLVIETLAREGEDGRPRLVVERGPDAGSELFLSGTAPVVVGRSKDADFVLSDADTSRRHVEVRRKGDALVVADLGSKAGSSLADVPLGETPQLWRPGTLLHLGASALGFSFEAASALAEIERMPDKVVSPAELWPAAAIEETPPPETALDADDEPAPVADEATALAQQDDAELLADVRERNRGRWNVTDFAVVLLALGVFSLSAVGYFVLLK